MSTSQSKYKPKHKPSIVDPIVSDSRRQHSRISEPTEQIADANGDVGAPWRAEGLLARLERHGDIGIKERVAGEEFQRLFWLSAQHPLRAADMSRVGGGGTDYVPSNDAARRRRNAALDALGGQGSPCGCCAWFVLGEQMTMREWAQREGWGGRPIREEVAKGTLIGALGVLVKHFGM
jgi:hypothetical protein